MPHTAEIIAVGNELLFGSTTNTNAREISQALNTAGLAAAFHTVVGDDPAPLRAAVALARAPLTRCAPCSMAMPSPIFAPFPLGSPPPTTS